MKDPKTLQMFDSIPKFETFSKYNNSLKKVFKGNCLKYLVHNLKHPRKPAYQGILEEITKKSPEDDDDDILINKLNIKKDEPSLLEDTNETFFTKLHKHHIETKSSPIPLISLSKTNRNNEFIKKKLKFEEPSLDPFKYTPNYNSIYKNTPCAFIKPLSHKKYNTEYGNSFDNTFLTGGKYITKNNSNQKSFTKNNKKIFKNIKEKIKKIDIKKEKNESKNYSIVSSLKKRKGNSYNKINHSMRFSKYISRKDNIYNKSKVISYIQPYDYISAAKKKTIDFNKMLNRSPKVLLNVSSLQVPPSCYYNPKYDLLEQKPMSIIFNEEANLKTGKNNKKYLLQKLWTSYDVKQEYQLVDNNKLNDDVLKSICL